MGQSEVTWKATVASNLLAARKKNGRLGSKKTRSGCLTCKLRRVKCDETKPECNRCRVFGRGCGGYGDLTLQSKRADSVIGTPPSHILGLKDGESRTFDFFLSYTAPRLAGSLDKDFWCGYVLQLAHSEPVVLDSLLAISKLYEHPQYLASFHRNDSVVHTPEGDRVQSPQPGHTVMPPPLDEHHAAALRHYNRAMRGFQKRIDEGDATPMLALLSCVLFICIEVIRDNVFGVFSLFARGTELLNQFECAAQDEASGGVFSLLKLMLIRIGVIGTTFGHPDPMDFPPEYMCNEDDYELSDMNDARTKLFQHMADSQEFIRDAHSWKESLTRPENNGEHTDQTKSNDAIRMNSFDIVSDVSSHGLKVINQSSQYSGPSHKTFICETWDPTEVQYSLSETLIDPSTGSHSVDSLEDLFRKTRLSHLASRAERIDSGRLSLDALSPRLSNLSERLADWFGAFQRECKSLPVLFDDEVCLKGMKRKADLISIGMLQSTDKSDPEAGSYVLMFYYSCLIWLHTRLDLPQTGFDKFTPEFHELVRNAEVYIASKAKQKAAFTFEVGAIPMLYFAAGKCRLPSLRRKALDLLLKAPGKEFTFGARTTSELIRRLITIEETGLALPSIVLDGCSASAPIDDTLIPTEEARVHNLELLKNNITNRHEVRITRYSEFNGRLVRHTDDVPL